MKGTGEGGIGTLMPHSNVYVAWVHLFIKHILLGIYYTPGSVWGAEKTKTPQAWSCSLTDGEMGERELCIKQPKEYKEGTQGKES